MNVDREVARSVFTSLAGSLVNMSMHEATKPVPNQSRIDFCELVSKALFHKHSNFSDFTSSDVENVFAEIAPILKGIRLASSKLEKEQIVDKHHAILQRIIDETGVKHP